MFVGEGSLDLILSPHSKERRFSEPACFAHLAGAGSAVPLPSDGRSGGGRVGEHRIPSCI
jgi:hypothetical protein